MGGTILIQGIDASNSIETPNYRFAQASAKIDVFIAGLLDTSCVVPAGNVGDSRIFHQLVAEVFTCKNVGSGTEPWVPFRLALDKRFHHYTDFATQYQFDASGKRALVKDESLAILGELYKARKFNEIDDHLPKGTGLVASLIHQHIESQAAQRPVTDGVHRDPNYLSYISYRLEQLRTEDYNPKIRHIKTTINRLNTHITPPTKRGDFYNLSADFEDGWPLVRLWIDDYFSHDIQNQYDVASRAATTHTVEQHQFSDLEMFVRSYRNSGAPEGYEFLQQEIARPQQIEGHDPKLDFNTLWELHHHDEFRQSAKLTREIINGNYAETQKNEQLESHIELVASHSADIMFNRSRMAKMAKFMAHNSEQIAENAFVLLAMGVIASEFSGSDALGFTAIDRAAQDVVTALDNAASFSQGASASPLAYAAGSWALRKKMDQMKELQQCYGNLLRYHLRKQRSTRSKD